MLQVILIRGLHGSGKSTLAREKYVPQGFVHLETDQFFTDIKTGRYAYNPKKLDEARKWCRDCVYNALLAGRNVVVSDTFHCKRLVEPYQALAKRFLARLNIVTLTTQFKSSHHPNPKVNEELKERWEEVV